MLSSVPPHFSGCRGVPAYNDVDGFALAKPSTERADCRRRNFFTLLFFEIWRAVCEPCAKRNPPKLKLLLFFEIGEGSHPEL